MYDIGLGLHAVAQVCLMEQGKCFFIGLEVGGFFQLLEHQLSIAQLLLDFGIGHVAGSKIVLKFEGLLESDTSLFVVFGFVINKS